MNQFARYFVTVFLCLVSGMATQTVRADDLEARIQANQKAVNELNQKIDSLNIKMRDISTANQELSLQQQEMTVKTATFNVKTTKLDLEASKLDRKAEDARKNSNNPDPKIALKAQLEDLEFAKQSRLKRVELDRINYEVAKINAESDLIAQKTATRETEKAKLQVEQSELQQKLIDLQIVGVQLQGEKAGLKPKILKSGPASWF